MFKNQQQQQQLLYHFQQKFQFNDSKNVMWSDHQVKSSIHVSMINLKNVLNIFSNFTFAFIDLFIAKNYNFIQQRCTQLIKSWS